MRILLSGGTGLIGQALCKHWQHQRHELWVWSRKPQRVPLLCPGAHGIGQLTELDDIGPFDAVINLAGAPIADRPWTHARRKLLWRSRVDLTRHLVDWIGQQPVPPRVLVSGSAVGWYGNGGERWLDEGSASCGTDFGSRLCSAWEEEAERARRWDVRVALLRSAPVLAAHGGMLKRLLPVFRLGLGGRLGDGQQWMPWIHLHDQVALINHLLHHETCSGPFNACAPQAVRNAEFTQTLAHTLRRPAVLPVPAWVLRAALGEMSVLLLGGQRLKALRTEASGYQWQYPEISGALTALLQAP